MSEVLTEIFVLCIVVLTICKVIEVVRGSK